MKTIVITSIHSGDKNSFCNKDYNGYKEFDTQEIADQFIKENKFTINKTYKDKELGFNLIYLETLEHNHRLAEVKSLFVEGSPEESIMYWDKQEESENKQRKEQGYIRCKKYDDMTSEDFKGRLNKSLTKDVLEYISTSKGIFGYIGHAARTCKHDEALEEVVENINLTLEDKEIDKWKALGSWLTSTSARHFMDSVEDEPVEIFEQKIKDNITNILISGFIYNLPEHEGSYSDTIKLTNIYKDKIKVV